MIHETASSWRVYCVIMEMMMFNALRVRPENQNKVLHVNSFMFLFLSFSSSFRPIGGDSLIGSKIRVERSTEKMDKWTIFIPFVKRSRGIQHTADGRVEINPNTFYSSN